MVRSLAPIAHVVTDVASSSVFKSATVPLIGLIVGTSGRTSSHLRPAVRLVAMQGVFELHGPALGVLVGHASERWSTRQLTSPVGRTEQNPGACKRTSCFEATITLTRHGQI